MPDYQQLYGKYRGVVTDNNDLTGRGCVRAKLPAFDDLELGWALPCSPYAGDGVGLFLIPPKGANVWIEFEGGDVESPIWCGCFWDLLKAPVIPALPFKKVLKTDSATITLDDTPGIGKVTIETKTGFAISLGPTGLEIKNPMGASITMTGPKVAINGTALEVT
jgi:hypothetical protein